MLLKEYVDINVTPGHSKGENFQGCLVNIRARLKRRQPQAAELSWS